jgi:SSS family solute:Na+ symporter
VATLILGATALLLAWKVPNVLELMLHSYSFMVSGLFIPVLAGIFLKERSAGGAFWSMIGGGTATLILIVSGVKLPFDLSENIFGIFLALAIYVIFHIAEKNLISSS